MSVTAAPSSADVLIVESATRRWGERVALDSVTFSVRAGELFALIGPNGAGKTTLIRAVTGRAPLDDGRIEIRGPEASGSSKGASLGLVPQSLAIYTHLTPRENLSVFARLAAMPPGVIEDAVQAALERVGLESRAGDRTSSLSGGMQRRLNIAAGILHNPPLLLLDEPTVGVDVVARETIHDVLRKLRRLGMAILLTTHDLDQAGELADRVGVLSHGRLLATDTPTRLIAETFGSKRELLVTLHDAPSPSAQRALEGYGLRSANGGTVWGGQLMGGLDQVSILEDTLAEAGANVDEVRIREPSLRSVFFNLTGEDVAP
jgi:ABC-2 type transport system ATP-binding protein